MCHHDMSAVSRDQFKSNETSFPCHATNCTRVAFLESRIPKQGPGQARPRNSQSFQISEAAISECLETLISYEALGTPPSVPMVLPPQQRKTPRQRLPCQLQSCLTTLVQQEDLPRDCNTPQADCHGWSLSAQRLSNHRY